MKTKLALLFLALAAAPGHAGTIITNFPSAQPVSDADTTYLYQPATSPHDTKVTAAQLKAYMVTNGSITTAKLAFTLAPVALSGSYTDLINLPALQPIATTALTGTASSTTFVAYDGTHFTLTTPPTSSGSTGATGATGPTGPTGPAGANGTSVFDTPGSTNYFPIVKDEPSQAAAQQALNQVRYYNVVWLCHPVTGSSSPGAFSGVNYRTPYHTLPNGAVSDLRVLYINHSSTANSSGATPSVSSTLTLHSVLELASGTIIPLRFNGSFDVTVQPDGTVISDPVAADIPASSSFFVRTFAATTPGGSLPYQTGNGDFMAGNTGSYSVGETDNSLGTIGGSFNNVGFQPSAILGRWVSTNHPTSVGWIGDSISNGYGDLDYPTVQADVSSTNSYSGGSFDQVGWVLRAVNSLNVPLVNISYQGDGLNPATATQSSVLNVRAINWSLLSMCDRVGLSLSINDIRAGTSIALMQSLYTSAIAAIKGHGVKAVYICTATPNTTSTDNWATLTNQAPLAYETNRVTWNNLLRTNAASLGADGYIEVADAVESSRNSGLWKVNGYTPSGTYPSQAFTADGLHPSSFGARTISTNSGVATGVAQLQK